MTRKIVGQRSLVGAGGNIMVVVPAQFVKAHKLRKKQKVELSIQRDKLIVRVAK